MLRWMSRLLLSPLRAIAVVLILGLLYLLLWRGGEPGEPVQQLPPLRIVCQGTDKVVRCPTHCVVTDDGQADCRCQDFYYQRGDEPLQFSHTLCR